jgi:hypothetical protein
MSHKDVNHKLFESIIVFAKTERDRCTMKIIAKQSLYGNETGLNTAFLLLFSFIWLGLDR